MTDPSASASAVLSLIASDMAEVDAVIGRRLDSGVPLVGQVSRYIISSGGKRLRPALLLLVCGALGWRGDQRFNLAAVIEFIHTATLLHDDVVDDSTLRRGRATANQQFGNPASVLVGDFLYSRAFQMMLDAGSMRVMEILAEATNVIAEGEVMQLMNMHDPALGEAACATYGQALGTAFQVIDDVLDYDGDAEEMGKNLGDDLREGKVTLPLIAAMQRGTPAQTALIRHAVETGALHELEHIVAVVRETGALEVAREAAAAEARRAMDAAAQLPSNPHAAGLVQLAASLLQRRN